MQFSFCKFKFRLITKMFTIMLKKYSLTLLLIISLFRSFSQIAATPEDISPLLIGENLPNEIILNSKDEQVNLFSVLEAKPTIIVFYRGGWCPYCNAQLSALGEVETEILKLGYQIVAISPDDFVNIQNTLSENKFKYQLFSDPNGNLIQKVGIAFTADDKTQTYIAKKTKGEVTDILPVPTVMIVNQKGEILFEYINPNYKERISPKLLLAVLQNISK